MRAKFFIPRIWCCIVLVILVPLQSIHAQRGLFATQQELIGSKLWKFEFTEWLANQPADSGYKTKFKVLEFWATWCNPCLDAIPHINQLQQKFSDSNIVFFSITHQTAAETSKTLKKYNFETIVVSDSTRMIHSLLRIANRGGMVLPRTVILDEENRIRWYGTPNALTDELIQYFLKKLYLPPE